MRPEIKYIFLLRNVYDFSVLSLFNLFTPQGKIIRLTPQICGAQRSTDHQSLRKTKLKLFPKYIAPLEKKSWCYQMIICSKHFTMNVNHFLPSFAIIRNLRPVSSSSAAAFYHLLFGIEFSPKFANLSTKGISVVNPFQTLVCFAIWYLTSCIFVYEE